MCRLCSLEHHLSGGTVMHPTRTMVLTAILGAAGCGVPDRPTAGEGAVGALSQAVVSNYVVNRGGPVVGQPKVVVVFWTPNVSLPTKNGITGFYSTLLSSAYMAWTNADYGVNYGSADGPYTISPGNGSTTL